MLARMAIIEEINVKVYSFPVLRINLSNGVTLDQTNFRECVTHQPANKLPVDIAI